MPARDEIRTGNLPAQPLAKETPPHPPERRGHRQEIQVLLLPTHLEDFHHDFLVVGDVDGFKDLAVFATAKLPNKLVVILIAVGEEKGVF